MITRQEIIDRAVQALDDFSNNNVNLSVEVARAKLDYLKFLDDMTRPVVYVGCGARADDHSQEPTP